MYRALEVSRGTHLTQFSILFSFFIILYWRISYLFETHFAMSNIMICMYLTIDITIMVDSGKFLV